MYIVDICSIVNLRPVVAQGRNHGNVVVTRKVIIPTRGNEIFEIFNGTGNGKHCVEFRHSTCNVFRTRLNVRNGSVWDGMEMGTEGFNTRFQGSLHLPCHVRNTA